MVKKIIVFLLTLAVAVAFPNNAYADNNLNRYYSVKNNEMKIALTFDDGPHPKYTNEILDILKLYNIKATFFVIGENVKYYPEPLKRAYAEGHEIGNHTFSHVTANHSSICEILSELNKCNEEVKKVCGISTKLFRPPQGIISGLASNNSSLRGYNVILWSIDTRDWDHNPPDKISKEILSTVKSGDIILMHDFVGKNSPTPQALKIFIPELLKRGYKFVTVSELINTKSPD